MSQEKRPVRVPERLLPGAYATQMVIRHTREEFLIDFINRFPPEQVVTARVIVSPGHLKRMIGALSDNLRRFEATHGPVVDPDAAIRSATPPAEPESPEQPAPANPEGAERAPAEGGQDDVPGTPIIQQPESTQQPPQAKVPEEVLGGAYANQMVVSHSREEFLIDFVNMFPPEGIVTARVFVSPGQLKRMIRALSDNFARHEAAHGTIIEATLPQPDSYLN